jgi:hypothetical protein
MPSPSVRWTPPCGHAFLLASLLLFTLIIEFFLLQRIFARSRARVEALLFAHREIGQLRMGATHSEAKQRELVEFCSGTEQLEISNNI